jgi:hypothetical protein
MNPPNPESPHKLLRVYNEAVQALRGLGIEKRVAAAGYDWDPGAPGASPHGITVRFLGTDYRLSVPDGELVPGPGDTKSSVGDADPSTPRDTVEAFAERILILHYLVKASGKPLTGRFVGFDQLAGGRFYGSAFRKRTELPLAALFEKDPGRLEKAAAMMGGGPGGHGSASALLLPFPRVPMTLIVWAGDDEIPSNAKVLFDDTAEDYLTTEDLTVLGDQVVRRLREASK